LGQLSDSDPRLEALETLYRSGFTRFLRVCTAILHDEELARDAVQEGFAQAIRARKRFRGQGSLEGWVWRIVVNVAKKSCARNPVAGLGTEEIAARNGRLDIDKTALRTIVASLPERQRLVIFLRYYARLDYRGIAEVLGIRTGTVSATLHQAHMSLRSSLEEAMQ
jgi:RNA polymerase sigma-70 factor (ECF subfamily)